MYRDMSVNDMATRLIEQDREIQKLREERDQLERNASRERRTYFTQNLWQFSIRSAITTGVVLLAVLLMVGGGGLIYKVCSTPNQHTSCTIEYADIWGPNDYKLVGIVPWHQDHNYGQYSSVEQALQVAETLHCPTTGLPE